MPQGSVAIYISLLIVSLAFSAVFSATEAVLLSIQRVRIQYLVRSEVPGAQLVARLVENPQRFLPTILLANNLSNTAAAALGTAIAVELMDSQGAAVLAATAVVTVILLIFGEAIPKTLGVRHAESASFVIARPVVMLGRVLLPFVWVLNHVVSFVLKPLGGAGPRDSVTEEEVKAMISVGRESGAVASLEARLMERILRFADHQVREVMTPRTELIWVERGTELGQFLATFGRQPRSHYPIFEETQNNVTGILSSSEVLKGLALQRIGFGGDVTVLARKPVFVPETKLAAEILEELQESDTTAVIAVDEFGDIGGIVTIVQLGEEIMGPLEFQEGINEEEEEVEALDEATFVVDGAMHLHDLNERIGLSLPEGEYETIAGFLLEGLGNIPVEGQQYQQGNVTFTVTEMDGLRVDKVRISYTAPPEPEESPYSEDQ